MKNTKFVFESFDDYVNIILEGKNLSDIITEAEERANLDAVIQSFIGELKLTAATKANAEEFFENLELYIGDNSGIAKKINDSAGSAFENLKNSQKGLSIQSGIFSESPNDPQGTYKYLIHGTVQAKGIPNPIDYTINTGETQKVRLYNLLAAVNAYNIITFSKNVESARSSKNEKLARNYEGRFPENSYLHLVDESLKSRTLEFVTKNPVAFTKDDTGPEFKFPLYQIRGSIKKGEGNNLEAVYFEEVIKPGGAQIEIKEKAFNSTGVDFFKENEVVISEDGINSIKQMVSQFNKITEIKVNGSASSKQTSREGGNQKLAEDRMKAGIKALEDLQKSGVEQLKGAKIIAGTATVQKGDAAESDPSMQQVSFSVSGFARSSEIVNDDPVIIQKVEKTKADSIRLQLITVGIFIKGDITA